MSATMDDRLTGALPYLLQSSDLKSQNHQSVCHGFNSQAQKFVSRLWLWL